MTLSDFAYWASGCAAGYFQPEVPLFTGEQKQPAGKLKPPHQTSGLAYWKASHHLSFQGNQVRLTLPWELLRFAILAQIKILYRWLPSGLEECCLMALFLSTQSYEQAATKRTSLRASVSTRRPSPCRSDAWRLVAVCLFLHHMPEVGEGADLVCLLRMLTLPFENETKSRG